MSKVSVATHLSTQDREVVDIAVQLNSLINNTTITQSSGVTGVTTSGLDTAKLCQEYRKIRPTLEKFLPYIGYIPVVGGTTVAAIRTLMTIVDTFCGADS